MAGPRHLIFRTVGVYRPFGNNFAKTMLRLAETRDEITVVADQWGNPTSAQDRADGILQAARRLHADPEFDTYGVYHLARKGDSNWSRLARRIFQISSPAVARKRR